MKDSIAAAAITLFAERGYAGVGTRDVAKRADTTEGSIFRIFVNKKGLFTECLKLALDQTLDAGQFLLMIYEGEEEKDRLALLTEAILRWYSSVSVQAARLVLQAYSMKEWRDDAYGRIAALMDILEKVLRRGRKGRKAEKTDFAVAAQAPIFALLQFKMTYAVSGAYSEKEEREMVTGIIQQWLRGVLE